MRSATRPRWHTLYNFACAGCGVADMVLVGVGPKPLDESKPTLCQACSLAVLDGEAR